MAALRISKLLVLLGAAVYPAGPVEAQSTAFTYQGQLKEDGVPANGSYDLEFKLFDALKEGTQVGSTFTKKGAVLTNGLFQETLDFGAGAFAGERRWIEVTANGTLLSPRQEITAAPYALSIPGLGTSEDGVVVSGDVQAAGEVTASAFSSNSPLILKVNPSNTECARFDDANCFLGLGTTTPHHRLSIAGGPAWTANFWGGALELDNAAAIAWQSNTAGRRFGIGQTTGGLYFFHSASDPGTTTDPADYDMIISDRGLVGIGTTTPDYPLTIRTIDSIFAAGYGWVHTNGTVEVGSYVSSASGWLGTRSNHPLHFFTNDSGAQVTLTTAGSLGIGTSTVPAGVKLAVDGKVLCEEMEVQLSGDWPDYVFDESYSLMPLAELEKTVERQKHLPGIPSAAEIAKDGLNVGQMQAQLVEKVEELTLYMIQINKQLERVERENAKLKARLAVLEGNP